jgi:TRAP-type C4-dicarboxylate transport system permease small subunit
LREKNMGYVYEGLSAVLVFVIIGFIVMVGANIIVRSMFPKKDREEKK